MRKKPFDFFTMDEFEESTSSGNGIEIEMQDMKFMGSPNQSQVALTSDSSSQSDAKHNSNHP